MKKTDKSANDELRNEYDLSKMEGAVKGRYAKRYTEGSNIIALAPDVMEAFPTSEAVNEALRMLMTIAKTASKKA